MWDVFGNTDLFVITTNPIRRKDGAVVMGRGIALEAKKKFPHLPYDFGTTLEHTDFQGRDPGFGIIDFYEHQLVGYFMTKHHWRESSVLSVIENSTDDLIAFLTDGPIDYRVDLNFPGIGNGKLTRQDVLPIIQRLPDNVHIWEYDDSD